MADIEDTVAASVDNGHDAQMMMASIGRALNNVGEMGQIGIVWFSIGVAVWQMLVIGKSLLTSGGGPLSYVLGRSVGGGKPQLVSGNTRDVIEMGFWILRFLEDFEKQYAQSSLQRSSDSNQPRQLSNGVGKIWSSNARSYLKMMRYVTKFLSTSDNFQKKNRPKKA